MSTIMVIAGGDWQIELIKKAKSMGHYVICSNLYKDSKGFKYADLGEVADVLDKQKNLEIAKKHSPDAVISDQSDIAERRKQIYLRINRFKESFVKKMIFVFRILSYVKA